MAFLFTHHDPQHAHAIVGALVLAQFAWRWWGLLAAGSAWRPYETVAWQIATVALHAALPLLSLRLPLPVHRNITAPMIWPEFQYHSTLFSTRHVLACACALVLPTGRLAIVAQLVVAHVTMRAASEVTATVGDAHRRTTNAMPYPPALSDHDVRRTKRFYTYAQMFATAMSISGDSDLAYMPLLAIQLAPLLMTLVRKGIVGASTYHLVYSAALAAPLLGQLAVKSCSAGGLRAACFATMCGFVAMQLRVRYGYGKHIVWLIAPVVGWAVTGRLPIHIEAVLLTATIAYMGAVFVAVVRAFVRAVT